MREFLRRFWTNPRSTVAGIVGGGGVAGVLWLVYQQAHCDMTAVDWWGIFVAGVVPMIIGGGSSDPKP